MIFREIQGDLFSSNENLAHCVSSDFKMGLGIAKIFRKRFGCVNELLKQNKLTGDVAMLVTLDFSYDYRFFYKIMT